MKRLLVLAAFLLISGLDQARAQSLDFSFRAYGPRNVAQGHTISVILLARNAAHAQGTNPLAWLVGFGPNHRIRETAFNIMSNLIARDLGSPPAASLEPYVDIGLGYFDAIFVSRTEPYVQPFMIK